jgi:hypothetical protein
VVSLFVVVIRIFGHLHGVLHGMAWHGYPKKSVFYGPGLGVEILFLMDVFTIFSFT